MDRTTLVEQFMVSQRNWLEHLSARNPALDKTTTQWDMVLLFRDLLLSTIEPPIAAQRMADLILSNPDIMQAYEPMWGCFFQAVEFFPSNEISSLLANFLASLAGLPDAINTRQGPMTVKSSSTTIIQPGHPIIVHWAGREEHLWRGLPHFSLYLRERINGPEAYLSRGDSSETAKAIWRNIITFVAILFRDHGDRFPGIFGSLVTYAFTTLADALEHPPGSRFGRNLPLHLPAACQWILLAGPGIYNAVKEGCNEQYWLARAGRLWTREGGTDKVDESRWMFWKHRFEELKADARLDADMNWEAAQAELRMCGV